MKNALLTRTLVAVSAIALTGLSYFNIFKYTDSAFAAAPCIVTIFGVQYDVSPLQTGHSGGNIFVCGTDMTATYQGMHGTNVSRMTQYLLSTSPSPSPSVSPTPSSTPSPSVSPSPSSSPSPSPSVSPSTTPSPSGNPIDHDDDDEVENEEADEHEEESHESEEHRDNHDSEHRKNNDTRIHVELNLVGHREDD